jgi:organic radical activating enzyme
MKSFIFNIDTLGVGQCNLRCPSCSVGNSDIKNPTGLMKPELLQQILLKATQELHVSVVGLFNWTEPLLHPQLPDLIRIINSFKIPSFLSSNLSLKKDFRAILEANPSSFRISVSGFNQPVYSQFHGEGNIELVKENMIKLSETRDKVGSTTYIQVLYHRYLGNSDDEILMRNYANSLGFDFQPVWAYFMNLEKIIAFFDGNKSVLSQNDVNIINKMVLPFWETTNMLIKNKYLPCTLREDQITLDKDGNVLLCCACYDTNKCNICNYLELPINEIQTRKHQNQICVKCMNQAAHVYLVSGTIGNNEIDEIAFNNIKKYYLDNKTKPIDIDDSLHEDFIEEVVLNNVISGNEKAMDIWRYFNRKFEYDGMFQDFYCPWAGHRYFAYDLIRNVKPKLIVELGTHKGTSFFSFCQAVKDARYDASMYAIDTWTGDEQAGFYDETVFNDVNKIKEEYYGGLKISLLRKTFDEAVGEFEDNSIDLLHIDGFHSYDAVKHDFDTWFHKVKKDGVILMHDIFISRDDYGVYKFWEELKSKYGTIEFHQSYGLGVLFKDGSRYQTLIDKEREWQIRYSSIAEDRKIEKIIQSFTEFNASLSELNGQMTLLNQTMAERDAQISALTNVLADRDSHINDLNSYIDKLKAHIEKQAHIINNKNTVINKLKAHIENQAQRIKEKNTAISQLKSSTSWKITRPLRSIARFLRGK